VVSGEVSVTDGSGGDEKAVMDEAGEHNQPETMNSRSKTKNKDNRRKVQFGKSCCKN